jgi:peptidoglycan hydrolase CwlO-like protein
LKNKQKTIYNQAEEDELQFLKDMLKNARNRLGGLEEELERLRRDLRRKQDELGDLVDEIDKAKRQLALADKSKLDPAELDKWRKRNRDLEHSKGDLERLLNDLEKNLKRK